MGTHDATVASQATIEALELPSLLAMCAELSATDLGRARVLALGPIADKTALERRQRLLQDTATVLQDGALVPSQEEPLRPLLEGLESRRPSLDGARLVQLASILRSSREASHRICGSEAEIPDLEALAARLPDCENLRRRISRCLDSRGRVKDDASPRLVQLRQQVHEIRGTLYKEFQQILSQGGDHFSSDTVSLKEGRLTLLLHAGAWGRVQGLVHGKSAKGQSFYFEPLAVVEGNNRLQESLEEEEAERQRVLQELLEGVLQHLPGIEAHFEFIGHLDLLQSLSRFAVRSESVLPELGGSGELRLVAGRHPLLDPRLAELRAEALGSAGHTQSMVPLDLELNLDRRLLVITGPNAGGKTVALKTVGLLTLASQCGLPIPAAAGTRLPLFGTVMAMVGDEQDLLMDRSTFSARLMRLREAWTAASSDSLILLDEVGSGTDPEEGSALAVALLEGLVDSGTLGVLTTHLTQLAAVALERPGATCAAMEFDPETGLPTFHLRPGAPGGSQALALARRLDLPDVWLRRAEELLGDEHRDLRNLLAEVEEVRRQLAATQAGLESEKRDLETHRRRLAEELSALNQERRRLAPGLQRELEDFRARVTRQLRSEEERLRQELEEGRRKGLVSASVARLFEDAPEVVEESLPTADVEVGARVRHRSLGWEGRLKDVRGQTAEVVVGGKRLRCPLEDLTPVGENGRQGRSRQPRAARVVGPADAELDHQLNLVGSRVEPALEALDRYLDRALLSNHGQVRIIHGFGSGRLRQAIRECLRSHPAVAEFRAGRENEGGDGATVVILDKS